MKKKEFLKESLTLIYDHIYRIRSEIDNILCDMENDIDQMISEINEKFNNDK